MLRLLTKIFPGYRYLPQKTAFDTGFLLNKVMILGICIEIQFRWFFCLFLLLKEKPNDSWLLSQASSKQREFDEIEVETETEDEEIIEKEVEQAVFKEFKVARVSAKSAYNGDGLAMKKGEVCPLVAILMVFENSNHILYSARLLG